MGVLKKTTIAAVLGLTMLGAGAAKADGVSLSISVADSRYDDRRYDDRYDRRDHRRYDRHDRYDRYDRDRVVKRQTFNTRYRARIQLVEEVTYRGRHRDLVCTVSVNGPDARRVRDKDVRRIAQRYCSRGAHVRVYA
ncbi:MAG: hypothetical protein RIE56_09350 [Amphiplicatus sp.]